MYPFFFFPSMHFLLTFKRALNVCIIYKTLDLVLFKFLFRFVEL